jgi:small-conductance mechanosensitive channel
VWMKGFGDNAVGFAIQCWIQDPEEGVGNIQSAVLKKVWALFKENGIELPYPQRDLHIRGSGEFERLMALLEARAVNATKPG